MFAGLALMSGLLAAIIVGIAMWRLERKIEREMGRLCPNNGEAQFQKLAQELVDETTKYVASMANKIRPEGERHLENCICNRCSRR